MKRFVLSCCILAATSTMVFAQAAKSHSPKATTQSKASSINDFYAKVSEFNKNMQHNDRELAKQRFEDLKHIMTLDLQSLKPKIVNAANDVEKQKWMNVLNKKQDIYFTIINMASDMHDNRAEMVKKYKEYAATL